MGPHSEARPICEFSPDHGHVMILYDTLSTLADDCFHLNNPLGRGMESMIVSRTKVDHCLQNCNNDNVDGEDDMNYGDYVQVEDLENNDRGPGRGKLPCQ